MILLDALYINGGGGKVLLDYLIDELEKTNKQVFYLIDKRIETDFRSIKSSNVIMFCNASLKERRAFYQENKKKFSSVLCFGNLPPSIKIEAKVFTYFHQPLYLKIPKDFSWKSKLMYKAKTIILNQLKKNTDEWWVQSEVIKNEFQRKYKVQNVEIMPFYPPIEDTKADVIKEKHSYIYISNATSHKNHQKLIDAFCMFYDKNKKGKLILTVSQNYPNIYQLIQEKQALNYPIENLGFVKREDLAEVYRKAEFIIFPSLAESFGLGLIEAIEKDCKVIGADLPYTFAVCEPSLTFNPLEVDSIVDALSLSLQNHIKPSISRINNNIVEIINRLS